MSEDEALKLALEALVYASSYCNTYDAIDAVKQALAAPVQPDRTGKQLILAEREACAKVCEAVHTGEYDTPEFWREGVAYTCAAAIRARGNT